MSKGRTYYVAQAEKGFAAYGHETGMGRALVTSPCIEDREVIKAESPAGLMAQIGGHYRGFKAMKVVERVERKLSGPEPWADPEDVWDR